MEFTINSGALKGALSVLVRVVSANAILPIMENILFDFKGKTLTLRATDLEHTMIATLDVPDGKKEGAICIPAKILIDTLKNIAKQDVTFSINLENLQITIQAFEGVYKIAGEQADDFPSAPVGEDMQELPFEKSDLMHILETAASCVSNDELRPAMTGVYIEANGKGLNITGTDAHKLYTNHVEGKYKKSDPFIVPGRTVTTLKGCVSRVDEVKLKFNKNTICFSFDNIEFYSRLIDAKYPDYRAVIPKESSIFVTLAKAELVGSLRRLRLYANKTTNQVIVTISEGRKKGEGRMKFESEDMDFSISANEEITCDHEGEPIRIGFNAIFMLDILDTFQGSEVVLEMTGANRAILLKDKDHPGQSHTYLVMPVMISEPVEA